MSHLQTIQAEFNAAMEEFNEKMRTTHSAICAIEYRFKEASEADRIRMRDEQNELAALKLERDQLYEQRRQTDQDFTRRIAVARNDYERFDRLRLGWKGAVVEGRRGFEDVNRLRQELEAAAARAGAEDELEKLLATPAWT